MIRDIAQHNGGFVIKDKLLEELDELKEAIEKNDDVNIIEEMADVYILTQQYLTLNSKKVEFDEFVEFKIERTMKRLKIKKESN